MCCIGEVFEIYFSTKKQAKTHRVIALPHRILKLFGTWLCSERRPWTATISLWLPNLLLKQLGDLHSLAIDEQLSLWWIRRYRLARHFRLSHIIDFLISTWWWLLSHSGQRAPFRLKIAIGVLGFEFLLWAGLLQSAGVLGQWICFLHLRWLRCFAALETLLKLCVKLWLPLFEDFGKLTGLLFQFFEACLRACRR